VATLASGKLFHPLLLPRRLSRGPFCLLFLSFLIFPRHYRALLIRSVLDNRRLIPKLLLVLLEDRTPGAVSVDNTIA
jgi:hypothetical protein